MWIDLAVIIMILGSAYWVSYPLLKQRNLDNSAEEVSEGLAQELKIKKEDIYLAIKEMEFDHEMGKLSEEDYSHLIDRYMVKAARSLKKMDELEGKEKELSKEIEEEIEKEVLILRQRPKKGGNFFCTQCGKKAIPGDRFCSQCGKRLSKP